MMPSNPMSGSPSGGPAAPGPGASQMDPEQAKSMLVQVVTKAKALAEQYGIDFNEVVSAAGGGAKAPAKMVPPAPAMRGPGGPPAGRPPVSPM